MKDKVCFYTFIRVRRLKLVLTAVNPEKYYQNQMKEIAEVINIE